MKKLFDRGVFFRTIKDLVYIAILLIIIGVMAIIFGKEMIINDILRYSDKSISYNITNYALAIAVILGSFSMSITALSFAWSKKKADFEYALPVTKGTLYASKALAVIFVQIIVFLFITVVGLIFSWEFIGRFMFVGDILVGLVNALICSLIIIGTVFLAASITGKALSAIIFSMGILIIPFLLPISRYYSMVRLSGVDIELELIALMKPALYTFTNLFISLAHGTNFTRYIPGMMFSLALALIYISVGYFLFKKRSGEITGKYSKNKVVHYVVMAMIPFAILNMAAISALDYGIMQGALKPRYINELLTYIFAALALMFAYDAFTYKKLRKNNRIIWIFLPLVASAFLLNWMVAENVQKENDMVIYSGDVESVNIFPFDEVFALVFMTDMMPYGIINSNDIDITDKTIIAELAEGYNRNDEDNQHFAPIFVKFNFVNRKSVYKFVLMKEEYDTLTTTEKRFTKEYCNSMLTDWVLNKMDIDIIGKLNVRGRTKGIDVVDTYYITAEYTPNTAQKYMNAVNQINMSSTRKMIDEITPDTMKNIRQITVYFQNVEEHMETLMVFGRKNNTEAAHFFKIVDIIRGNGLKEPSADATIMKFSYYDVNIGGYKEVYTVVSEDEVNAIMEIYDERAAD